MYEMDKLPFKFPPNTRVRLREGVDPGFYGGFARAGNEGWIRKQKRDELGYTQVYIEFDKDHWAYNGAPDGWTWEGHFEPVGDSTMSDENKSQEDVLRALTEKFLQGILGALKNPEAVVEEPANVAPGVAPQEEDPEEKWDKVALEAAEAVVNAPSYAVVAITEKDAGEGKPPVLVPFVYFMSRNEEVGYLCQSQVAHLAAALQDRIILKRMAEGSGDE